MDDKLSASSNRGGLGPKNSRLNTRQSWSAGTSNQDQWIQAELGRDFKITGIQTRGRGDALQWVAAYKISYSTNGEDWTVYASDYGTEMAS